MKLHSDGERIADPSADDNYHFKCYKSCPASPVEWITSPKEETSKINTTISMLNKSHSLYSTDAENILEKIHNDSEEIIAEINMKYGDLNNPRSPLCHDPVDKNNIQANQHDDTGNFSSDSLEDCSLNIDKQSKTERDYKQIFRQEQRESDARCMVNSDRNVSLRDILNEEEKIYSSGNDGFSDLQKYSSSSFYLAAAHRHSQESLLSDDMSACGVSYNNSMESVLSDESECKSAPSEVIFGRKRSSCWHTQYSNKYHSSKSYGSSPNNMDSLDGYMDHQPMKSFYFIHDSNTDGADEVPTLSPTIQRELKKSYDELNTSNKGHSEYIPRLDSKNMQYVSHMNRSLSIEFADHRQRNNSNPLYNCSMPRKRENRGNSPLNSTPSATLATEGLTNSIVKSCSLDFYMHNHSKLLQQGSVTKKYEQNLEKFEKASCLSKCGLESIFEFVPHKPPVASRRTSSVKAKYALRGKDHNHNQHKCSLNKSVRLLKRSKSLINTVQEHDTSKENPLNSYATGTCSTYDRNVDSLELYFKPHFSEENSVDFLDDSNAIPFPPTKTNVSDAVAIEGFFSKGEYSKFKDIERKIDIINRLVKMEEKKLENERLAKEMRMRPFNANAQEKGYVKSLTMNFDNLAKAMQCSHTLGGKFRERNFSLPDVLEVAKCTFSNNGRLNDGTRERIEQYSHYTCEGAQMHIK